MERIQKEIPYFNGMGLPPFPRYFNDPVDAICQIREFTSRSSDIFVCGPMRSGNHWVFEIVSMLSSGKAQLTKDTLLENMIDLADYKVLEQKSEPRILTTHLPYRYLPQKHRENGNKIVLTLRNPKDRQVSLYYFGIGKDPRLHESYTWENHFNDMTMGRRRDLPEPFGNWFGYVREWERQMDKNSNIHVVYYEKLKKNFVDEVSKLANYLQCEKDEVFYRDIEQACSFDNMKQNKKDDTAQFDKHGRSTTYRTGHIGTWKNYFTKEQNEQFDLMYKIELDDCNLQFIYE